MKRNTIAALLAVVGFAVAAPFALADADDYGPGMMGGYGAGHGMMGGYGGQGAYGMGPGMMGGYGGQGVYGMGPGMMGGYGDFGLGALGLSDEQREKIDKIRESQFSSRWALMGKMHEQQFKFSELLHSGKADDAAIGKAFKDLEALRQQLQVSRLDAQKQVDAVLTKSQREQLQRGWGPQARK